MDVMAYGSNGADCHFCHSCTRDEFKRMKKRIQAENKLKKKLLAQET